VSTLLLRQLLLHHCSNHHPLLQARLSNTAAVLIACCVLQLFDEPGFVAVAEFSNPDTGLHAVAKHTCNADMAASEDAAMHALQDSSALLVAPMAAQRSSSGGIVLVSEFAGYSVEQLQQLWAQEPLKARVTMALQLLACMLLALQELGSLTKPQIYRDFKSGNITYDAQLGLFRLIDFGLMIEANKSNFFPGSTISHVAPEMVKPKTQPDGSGSSSRPLCTAAGMAAVTSPAIDVWALFLTALQVVLVDLPAQLDYETFEELNGQILGAQMFCEFLATWDPSSCPQLRHLAETYPLVADLFKCGLAADPAESVTVQQVLQHPALVDVVAAMRQRVADAAPVVAQHREVIRSLCSCDTAAATADATTVSLAAAGAAAAEGAQLMPTTPVMREHICAYSSSSGDESGASCHSCGSNVVDSDSSTSSATLPVTDIACSSSDSSAGCAAKIQPVEVVDTLSIGCFGGLRLFGFRL
jgi:serine/threonine protein kinase